VPDSSKGVAHEQVSSESWPRRDPSRYDLCGRPGLHRASCASRQPRVDGRVLRCGARWV